MRYEVYSPMYGKTVPVLDYGVGPMEYGSDVLIVEATNKRAAIRKAISEWRKRNRMLPYCEVDENPYTGVRAMRLG